MFSHLLFTPPKRPITANPKLGRLLTRTPLAASRARSRPANRKPAR